MDDLVFCPACGELMSSWQGDIYECEDCGNMVDIDVFEEED